MNHPANRKHSVNNLFTVILLGIFMIFLLLMLLFSAQAYRTAVAGNQRNNNLYTASAYITAKFRQHDSEQSISTGMLDQTPALCMTDIVNEKEYITYIYLKDQHLKELFTATDNSPDAQMGTDIASLKDFRIQQTGNFYRIILEDPDGNQSSLLLHSGAPEST